MAQETNDGAAYLAALKQSANPQAAGGGAPGQGTTPEIPGGSGAMPGKATQQCYKGPERRRSPRYTCEGSAEIRAAGTDVRTWVTLSDISLHGCYVEAQATYPVETVLEMKLEVNGFKVETEGKVRVSYPYLGMGIAFAEMPEENRGRLKELLGSISRPTVILGPRIASALPADAPATSVPLISDPLAAIQALIEFFEVRQMLVRDDFLRILRTSQSRKAAP
jgi:hypothetical protein